MKTTLATHNNNSDVCGVHVRYLCAYVVHHVRTNARDQYRSVDYFPTMTRTMPLPVVQRDDTRVSSRSPFVVFLLGYLESDTATEKDNGQRARISVVARFTRGLPTKAKGRHVGDKWDKR